MKLKIANIGDTKIFVFQFFDIAAKEVNNTVYISVHVSTVQCPHATNIRVYIINKETSLGSLTWWYCRTEYLDTKVFDLDDVTAVEAGMELEDVEVETVLAGSM